MGKELPTVVSEYNLGRVQFQTGLQRPVHVTGLCRPVQNRTAFIWSDGNKMATVNSNNLTTIRLLYFLQLLHKFSDNLDMSVYNKYLGKVRQSYDIGNYCH